MAVANIAAFRSAGKLLRSRSITSFIIPRTAGGETDAANLALACPHCNGHKWAHCNGVDPTSGEAAPLFNPRVHLWAEHFRWSGNDGKLLEGLSATGRVTIPRLQMNHPAMVEMRRLLRELGLPIE
jgi:5-methylcytosine-specific restriction endonuclease McrA